MPPNYGRSRKFGGRQLFDAKPPSDEAVSQLASKLPCEEKVGDSELQR